MKKKALLLMLSVAISMGSFVGCTTNTTGKGEEKPQTQEIKFDEEKSADLVVGDNKETEAIASGAIKDIPEKIVETNSVEVDSVSGATLTSERIKKAVVQYLTEAAK